MSAALVAALEAHKAGLCVVPPRDDGSKAPLGEWKRYQYERPTEKQLEQWYDNGREGVGLVCGAVSGSLEMLEFEGRARDEGLVGKFLDALEGAGLHDIMERISSGYTEETPSGGYHFLYRCEEIAGNLKLARRPATDDELEDDPKDKIKVLIETRGEGGYVIVAPSTGNTHPYELPWTMIEGGFTSIATITPEERASILEICRTFDSMPAIVPASTVPKIIDRSDGLRPGDDFAERTSWGEILEPHGWALVGRLGDEEFWRRPGKKMGNHSATTNYKGSDVLYVFSSSTEFEPERGYGKFDAWAHLNHGDDYSAAAKELGAQGFGDPPKKPLVQQYEEPPAELDDPWPDPLPLHFVNRLPLDLSETPEWFGKYIAATAENLQVPPDSVFMQALAAIGVTVARYVYIECLDGWKEPLNLYTMVALDPGERKTATSDRVSSPLERLGDELWIGMKDAATTRSVDRAMLEEKIKGLRAEIEKKAMPLGEMEKKVKFREIKELELELDELPPIPKPELLVENATPEALEKLIIRHGGRIGVISDEGGALLALFTGLYGSRSNFEIALKGHDGGRPIKRARAGDIEKMDKMERPILTMGLCVQLSVLNDMAEKRDLAGRGLLARFLYSIPEPRVGWRKSNPPGKPKALQTQFESRILELGKIALREDLQNEPLVLHLSAHADDLFSDFREVIERRLRGDGDLATITGWGSKFPGQTARIAGLLHLAKFGSPGYDMAVEGSTMRAAIGLAEYFISHALLAHSMMGEREGIREARRIQKWLTDARDGGVEVTKFSPSDLYAKTRLSAEDAHLGLSILLQNGWLRVTKGVTKDGKQRRDAATYVPHVSLRGESQK